MGGETYIITMALSLYYSYLYLNDNHSTLSIETHFASLFQQNSLTGASELSEQCLLQKMIF